MWYTYARRAPSRGHPIGHFRTRHGTRWAFHKTTGLEATNTHTIHNVAASRQPKVTWKSKVLAVMTYLELLLDPPGWRRPDVVRARPLFVAISSVQSHLRRSKRILYYIHRYLPSAVSSDDVKFISRELARPDHNLGHLEGRRGASAGVNVRHFIASERSTAFQTRFVSCNLIYAIRRLIR